MYTRACVRVRVRRPAPDLRNYGVTTQCIVLTYVGAAARQFNLSADPRWRFAPLARALIGAASDIARPFLFSVKTRAPPLSAECVSGPAPAASGRHLAGAGDRAGRFVNGRNIRATLPELPSVMISDFHVKFFVVNRLVKIRASRTVLMFR
ncbi:hypothetical protein EVAR_67586_1 [Eumeta japonica]|uniref:Uncharacterized protein n=1 Tax=Eumeta variegata TaxID=151549 RepID=A0A4C2A7N1_EUMVA|nr:hypothetical protein EVAR_67586_1 [Eumeta japonica]